MFGGNVTMAQEVSIDVAKSRTLDFLSRQSIGPKFAKGTTSSTDLELAYTSKSEAKTCFYVFNVGNDNGFVIAGGDEAALEILGYCDHGTFDYDTANPAFKWWLDQYTEQIAHAQVSTSSPRKAKAQTAERNSIEPLIKTKWDQDYPYNCEIPKTSNGYRYMTGCVATAMAQVMKYWEHPAQGTGSRSYYNSRDRITFEANFGDTTYDWDNMIEKYIYNSNTKEGNFTEEEAKAVGTLMYHAGVSVLMSYGTHSSSANLLSIAHALITYFGYDKSISNENRNYYSDEAWSDLIYNELSEHRPVLYAGGQHSFICDGYDVESDMFSFNWGWNGSGDGYFSLKGTSYYHDFIESSFNIIQVNVKPAEAGIESEEVLHIGQKNDSLFVKVGDESSDINCVFDRSRGALECTLNLSLRNSCTVSNQFDYGVMAVDVNNGTTYYSLSKSNRTFNIGTDTYVQGLMFFPYLWNAGTYKLYPVFRKYGQTSDADWKKMDIIYGLELPTITLKNNFKPNYVHFSVEKNYVLLGQTLQIEHDPVYSGKITYRSSNNNVATVDENGLITPIKVGKVTITVHGEADAYFRENTIQFKIDVLEKDYLKFKVENDKIMPGEYTQIYCSDYEYEGTIEYQSRDERIATVSEWGEIKGIYPGEAIIHVTASETELNSKTETDLKITVLPDVAFTEEPYFDNNNNVYENYWFLNYTLKNETDEVAEGEIYAEIYSNSGIIFGGSIINYSLEPGEEISDLIDFDDYVYFGYNEEYGENTHISDLVSPGDKLYLYLYRDMEEYIPWNYSEIVFTYCPTLTIPYRVSPSGFGTLILPYDWDVPYDMKVYTCKGVDENNVLTLKEYSSDYYDRNVPYIVYGDPQKQYTFRGPDAIEGDSYQAGLLIGAVSDNVPLEIGTDYILQDQGGKVAFYRYMGEPANRKATQFRAFLRLPEDASRQAPKINFPGNGDDETEGISTLSTDNLPAGIYTLDGHRQSTLQKGLNILILDDGTAQKVFVK